MSTADASADDPGECDERSARVDDLLARLATSQTTQGSVVEGLSGALLHWVMALRWAESVNDAQVDTVTATAAAARLRAAAEGASMSAVDAAHLADDGQVTVFQAKHTLPLKPSPPWTVGVDHWPSARLQLALVPVFHATELAREAQTQQQLGEALKELRQEAKLTIDQLHAKLKPKNIAGLGRSTIGRVCTGGTLCATRDALLALVRACGVPDADTEIWTDAWTRAKNSQRPRGRRPTANPAPDTANPVPDNANDDREPGQDPGGGTTGADDGVVSNRDAAGSANGAVAATANNDDEVLGTVNVAFTRRHLRAAVVLSAMLGLAAATTSSKGVSNAGAVVLGLAAGLAMYDMARNLSHGADRPAGEDTAAGSAAA